MSSLDQTYIPFNYRRICDLCGELKSRSQLRELLDIMVCNDHPNERRPQTLNEINARQRPFRILPVPNAKPEETVATDVFQDEDGQVFNLLDITRPYGARYAQVISGQATAAPNTADVIPVNSWACFYYYAVITDATRTALWIDKCKDRLRTSADALLALQTLTGTVAANSFYGGFLGTGATVYYSEDASTAGLSMLYAYRVLGDIKYLAAARAVASFLRNLQAIGSCGVHFTSSDTAGAARLYTGGVTNLVSTAAGLYADHCFFPSSLLALQFWNALKATDGDRVIGATAAISGDFTFVPSQLMSTCMTELRAFWATGTHDVVTNDMRTGLSTTTPSEFFNAYPQVKQNTDVIGTGSWEYQNGPAASGTLVTGNNFAKAMSALFAYEGLSTTVKAIDTWLQTFTSNSEFATPANTSPGTLARSTTGTYDATVAPPQFLLVRDADAGYAAIAKNGGSLYDWGAFGLMAPIWSARRQGTFKYARNTGLGLRRRLDDGLPSDNNWYDRGMMRGRQGLSLQTSFYEVVGHGPAAASIPAASITSPPTDDMVFWFRGDAGVTKDASNRVSAWADQTANHYDCAPVDSSGSLRPTTNWPVFAPAATASDIPALDFAGPSPAKIMQNNQNPFDFPNRPLTPGASRTFLALCKPNSATGGRLVCFRRTSPSIIFGCYLSGPQQHFGTDGEFVTDYCIRGSEVPLPNGTPAAAVDYTGTKIVITYVMDSGGNITVRVNGLVQATYIYNGTSANRYFHADSGWAGFTLGYSDVDAGPSFSGLIYEEICYGGDDGARLQAATEYLMARAGQLTSNLVYDAVAAAQFAAAFRLAPRSNAVL